MRFVIVGDEATERDIRDAIINLRAKQRRACIASTRAELGEDIDELLDLWEQRVNADAQPSTRTPA